MLLAAGWIAGFITRDIVPLTPFGVAAAAYRDPLVTDGTSFSTACVRAPGVSQPRLGQSHRARHGVTLPLRLNLPKVLTLILAVPGGYTANPSRWEDMERHGWGMAGGEAVCGGGGAAAVTF